MHLIISLVFHHINYIFFLNNFIENIYKFKWFFMKLQLLRRFNGL